MQGYFCAQKAYFDAPFDSERNLMKEIYGTYTSAKIFTDSIEPYALAQVQMLCDQTVSAGSKIRIMPDVHPGKYGPIGLTMTFQDRIFPALVGIDIGCGMTCARLGGKKTEYPKLDAVIQKHIPSGVSIRQTPHSRGMHFPYEKLLCAEHIHLEKTALSMGTLGGGNHFIEIDRDEEGCHYLTIHSGSRRLGKDVAEHYLRLGQKELKAKSLTVSYPQTWLEGSLLADYLHDVAIVQDYAEQNRLAILETLCKYMKWKPGEVFSCPHNYISRQDDHYLLRKGAISANSSEQMLIPINMQEGILLAEGKGNPDWNCSAPHGSGRLLKRTDVAKQYTVSQFKTAMKGIFCTCISKTTLAEAPFAYRDLSYIVSRIADTAKIMKVLTPVYNYKDNNEPHQRTQGGSNG